MFVLNALYDGECLQIEYSKFLPGRGYTTLKEFIYTQPLGKWTELKFSRRDRVAYIDFLLVMTVKNLEVFRRLSRLALSQFEEAAPFFKREAVNALTILDKTFYAPTINLECAWQCELLDHIVCHTSIVVISTCRNIDRLERYFNALQERAKQLE